MKCELSIGSLALAGSGTTLVNAVMDGLYDVAGVGDSYLMLDEQKRCYGCLPDPCPVFTEANMKRIRSAAGTKKWWDVLSDVTRCRVVYTQDGSLSQYRRTAQPDEFIIIVRNPLAWMVSDTIWREQHKRLQERPLPASDLTESKERWLRFYLGALSVTSGQPRVLLLEDLAANQEKVLIALLKQLGMNTRLRLSSVQEALEWWTRSHHKFGGRWRVGGKSDTTRSRMGQCIATDDLWRSYVEAGAAYSVVNDMEVLTLWEALLESCVVEPEADPLEESMRVTC